MAEALLNHLGGDRFHAESAGLEPGRLNPLAVAAMREMNIDISQKGTQDVFELWRNGRTFNFVVTVCDETSGERCPLFPGISRRLHWSFPDPGSFTGTQEEKLARTIEVRNQIMKAIQIWIGELNP
jgi:arsenate reductase